MNQFQPNYEQILIKIDPKNEKKSDSGLILQATDKTHPTAIVVAVGPTRQDKDPIVKAGDRVLLNHFGFQKLEDDYALAQENGILGIIKQ